MKKQEAEYAPPDERIDGTLLDHSTHLLYGDIEEDNVAAAIKWIIFENLAVRTKHLTLYVNSPGGDLYQSFALIDVMRTSMIPIHTVAVGQAMSAAFLIFITGARGHRYVGKYTTLMCHQYTDTPHGKHHDLVAQMQEGNRCNKRMVSIIESATGLSHSQIRSKLLNESDVYLDAEMALELNVANYIL